MTRRIAPLSELMKRVKRGIDEENVKAVRDAFSEMGPQRQTLNRTLYASPEPGMATVGACRRSEENQLWTLPMEHAAIIACGLDLHTDVIAVCIEAVLQQADAGGNAETISRIVKWLTANPELGLICCDSAPPATWRAVNTWRLNEVYPDLAAEWTRTARTLMTDAKMRQRA